MEPNEELLKAAQQLGFMGMVSHRDSMQKAYDDALDMAEDDQGAIGIQLVVNTWTLIWAQERLDTLRILLRIRGVADLETPMSDHLAADVQKMIRQLDNTQ